MMMIITNMMIFAIAYAVGVSVGRDDAFEWNDPKELPQDDKIVIAKFADKQYILVHYDHEWKEWISEMNDKFVEIIGWREIEE